MIVKVTSEYCEHCSGQVTAFPEPAIVAPYEWNEDKGWTLDFKSTKRIVILLTTDSIEEAEQAINLR